MTVVGRLQTSSCITSNPRRDGKPSTMLECPYFFTTAVVRFLNRISVEICAVIYKDIIAQTSGGLTTKI